MEQHYNFDYQLTQECAQAFYMSTGLGCTVSDCSGTVLHDYGYSCTSCQLCRITNHQKSNCTQAHHYGMLEAERFGGNTSTFVLWD